MCEPLVQNGGEVASAPTVTPLRVTIQVADSHPQATDTKMKCVLPPGKMSPDIQNNAS
jgi:hypothetical protein